MQERSQMLFWTKMHWMPHLDIMQGWKTFHLRKVWHVSWWLMCARLHYKLDILCLVLDWSLQDYCVNKAELWFSYNILTSSINTYIHTHIHRHTQSSISGTTDNLKLYRTAPHISIFSVLTRVQIIFSSAAAHYRWKPVTRLRVLHSQVLFCAFWFAVFVII